MRILVVLVFAVASLTACQKTATDTTLPVAASNLTDVSYGADPRQKMDLYLPAGRTSDSTKVILLIHGGAWNEGDKTDFNPYVAMLQASIPGYAIFNINYRLAAGSQNLFPTQENDVKAAAEFIFSKKSEYHISDKWAILGASAGGHLALLQSYKYSSPVKPKAVISFFGPTDLVSLYNSNPLIGSAIASVVGATPALNPSLYQQSGPINFATAQSPPTLLLQGGIDPLVPPTQSTTLRDKLQSAGVATQYVFYPTEGHGWEGANLNDSFARITAFLSLYVK